MDYDPQNFMKVFNENAANKETGPCECARLLSHLSSVLIEEQLSDFIIDEYVLHIFNKPDGLLSFIQSKINDKSFKDAVKNGIEVIFILLNNFPKKLKNSFFYINDICLVVLRSHLASADEKTKALDLLILSFENNDLTIGNEEHFKEIFKTLNRTVTIKKCDSVVEKVVVALGVFAKKYPYIIGDHLELKQLFIVFIDKEIFKKNDYSGKLVSGIFLGLTNFCESFPFDPENETDAKYIEKLYGFIMELTSLKTRIKTANREALMFFATNILCFKKVIAKNLKNTKQHKSFLEWFNASVEEKKVIAKTLNAYYRIIGLILEEEPSTFNKNIVVYFVKYFRSAMKDKNVSNYEKRSAMHGLKSFSGACKVQLKSEQTTKLFIYIMKEFEELFITNQNIDEELKQYLPDYITLVANWLNTKILTGNELFCLQLAVINMIKIFPLFSYIHHGLVIDSIVFTLFTLKQSNEKIFDTMLDKIIYNGVVWSCSHELIANAEEMEDDKTVTVKNYLPLWRGLLKIVSNRQYDKDGIFFEDRKYIYSKVINKLIKTLLVLINKLNTTLSLKEDSSEMSDIQSTYKVNHGDDFAIFLNVVDFYQEILQQIEPTDFESSIYKLINYMISKTVEYPLISGFYKLLSYFLIIANKLNLFEEELINSNQDIFNCYKSLQEFFTLLLNKINLFKDELLISVLQVILHYPILIIKENLTLCVPVFVTVFSVGRSYLKLAEMGIDVLQYWQRYVESEEMDCFLIEVVPLLDTYLRSNGLRGIATSNTLESSRKTAVKLKKRKIVTEIESDLFQIQNKILHFIGQQNAKICLAFVCADSEIEPSISRTPLLKLALPYDDVKLDIHLDRFVPRIVELALYSSDRKMRITACELLHGIIMLFLGKSKPLNETAKTELKDLFKSIISPLLQLGCDVDLVVRQLFEPLFFQIIHYYTHPNQYRSSQASIVIDTLMEGITHPIDSSLRDFAGKCLKEFVKWTIKQTTENLLISDPINIKVLVKNMRYFSIHPDNSKKLGAALMFNNIYRELREERSILSMFWVEFLHIFITSLSNIEQYSSENENTVTQISHALNHLQRGFVEKSDLFNKSDQTRRIPNEINGNSLNSVALWLLKYTSSKSYYCRKKSMELFISIAPLVKECKNKLTVFFNLNNIITNDDKWISETYEYDLIDNNTLTNIKSYENSTVLLKWLRSLLCALDGHIFVIENNLMRREFISVSSVLVTGINYFLKNIQTAKFSHALMLITPQSWNFTVMEEEEYKNLKCEVVLKILKITQVLLNNSINQNDAFWSEDLWLLILNAVFNPQLLGFDSISNKKSHLEILNVLLNKISTNFVHNFLNLIKGYINDNLSLKIELDRNIKLNERNLLKGLHILQQSHLNKEYDFTNYTKDCSFKLFEYFTAKEENGIIYLQELRETEIEYCNLIIQFPISNDNFCLLLTKYFFNNIIVQSSGVYKNIIFGEYLMQTFENVIIKLFIDKLDIFINIGFSPNFMENSLIYINHILNYLINNKMEYKNNFNDILRSILDKWEVLEAEFNTDLKAINRGLDFITLLLNISNNLNNDGLRFWVLNLLKYQNSSLVLHSEIDFRMRVIQVLALLFQDHDEQFEILRTFAENLKKEFFISDKLTEEEKSIFLNTLLTIIPTIKSSQMFYITMYILIIKEIKIDIEDHLKMFVKNANKELQLKTVEKMYEMVINSELKVDEKYLIINLIIPVLLNNINLDIFKQFYTDYIVDIITCLQESTTEDNLIKKILSFSLLELLFPRIPIDMKENHNSIVESVASIGIVGATKLIQTLLKSSFDVNKEIFSITEQNKELYRKYKCFNYKMLTSILCNSMKNAKFFTKLFVRQENGEDVLWTQIINTDINYQFQEDFDSLPKQRKILISIRDEIKAQRKLENSQVNSVKYLNSQRLFNSSLSDNITRFDFSNSNLRTESEAENDLENATVSIQNEILLDATDINNHECMATVCGLITYLVNNNVTPLPLDDIDEEIPFWLTTIKNLLIENTTHNNVKIYFVKLIHNLPHIFKYFAADLLEPLLKFINDNCAGTNINYFIVETISLLAAWSKKAIPTTEEEKNLASKLVEFIIQNITNERQDMFKYHIELLKLIIEAWNSVLNIPYDLILSKLSIDIDNKKVQIGIHLSAIYLANQIKPYLEHKTQFFFNRLINVMKSKDRTTYKPCAETIGLFLKLNSANGSNYYDQINNYLKDCSSDIDRYAYSLEGVALHFPDIVNSFQISRILSRLHTVTIHLQTIFLKLILQRINNLEEHTDFKAEHWDLYVGSNNIDIQIITLKIIQKSLFVLETIPRFKVIILSVFKHIDNPNKFVRSLTYDISIDIWKKNIESGSFDSVISECKDVIIQGILDNDEENRNEIYKFILADAKLPSQIMNRFLYVLVNLYKTSTEQQFLNYSTYFLIDIVKNCESYEEKLFDFDLGECDFDDYILNTNWRLQHPSVAPMFIETLKSYFEPYDLSRSHFNELRQTQSSMSFAPTLSQSSVRSSQHHQFTSSQSSLYLGAGNREEDNSFINPNYIQPTEYFKRRFLRDKSKISQQFAHRAVKKNVVKVEKRIEMAKQFQKSVNIYRKYRKGDLPDIQINLSSILVPLQLLCLDDGEVSKLMFSTIFMGVLSKNSNDNFLLNISKSIEHIFTNSVEFNTNLFQILLDILLNNANVFRFSPDIITSISVSSGLLSSGTLVLEKYLLLLDQTSDNAPDFKRARGYEQNIEINYWVKLAELYKEMDEWDTVRSIFLRKMNINEAAEKAVLAESKKQWREAQDNYQSLIQTDPSLERRDFYYESYFKCFAYLGEWENLPKFIDSVIDEPWNSLWDKNWNQQKLLPWYLSAQVKNMLHTQKKSTTFLKNLNDSLQNQEKCKYLKSNFAEELCMLWICENDIKTANIHLKSQMNSFLENWQVINPMFTMIRINNIFKLRNIIDVSKFINTYDSLEPSNSEQSLQNLKTYWEKTSNEELPSILLNETRVLYRKQFIELFIKKIQTMPDCELDDTVNDLNSFKSTLNFDITQSALNESNFYMAKKYLKLLGGKPDSNTQLAFCKMGELRAGISQNASEKIPNYIEVLKILNTVYRDENKEIQLNARSKQFDVLILLSDIFCNNKNLFEKSKESLTKIVGTNFTNPEHLEVFAIKTLREHSKKFEEILSVQMDTACKPEKQHLAIGNCYSKLAFAVKDYENYFSDFIIFVMKAMEFSSEEGKLLFPCIFIESTLSQFHELFIKQSEKIPTWMFLGWIPQLLANVSNDNVQAIKPIILRIAKTYPQSIMYSYRLSKENYLLNKNSLSCEAINLMKELDDLLLSDPKVDKFLMALSNVCIPQMKLDYYIKKMITAARKENESELKEIRETILKDIFLEKPNSKIIDAMLGDMYKRITTHENPIKKIDCKNYKKACLELNKIREQLNIIDKKNLSRSIKDYCPWLSNFSANKLNMDLEIPGQYDGRKLPLTQHHIKIHSVSSNVSILDSMRKPIKFTVLGNNTKQFNFLIKFGEDIRQDQRIEQLFTFMNDVLKQDTLCVQKQLSLETYQVIPLTTTLGLIQWVDNTCSFEEFFNKGMTNDFLRDNLKIRDEYATWIDRSKNSSGESYGKAAQKYSRDNTVANLNYLVNKIPQDILSSSIWSISSSTECYIALRNNFIRTYSVICLCQYLLGIGDRHLGNTKICERSGKALGIDFGHAFGTGTQILVIPELVPFRLTPHIIQLMEPLGENGQFRANMIHCLRSLQLKRQSLLAIMSVFIKEPSLDWLVFANRFEDNENPLECTWYPEQKIKHCKMKLEGVNPALIMIEELQSGHSNFSYCNAYVDCIKGNTSYNFRARKDNLNLSVEDQVDCLIDHATDYNLLGRMYAGWNPWV